MGRYGRFQYARALRNTVQRAYRGISRYATPRNISAVASTAAKIADNYMKGRPSKLKPKKPKTTKSYYRATNMKTDMVHIGPNRGGKYYKRFPKPRRTRRINKFNKYGAVYRQENGSVESVDIRHSVYIGHGVAPNQLVQNLVRALVRKLVANAGITIKNWTDRVNLDIYRQGVAPFNTNTDEIAITYNYKVGTDDLAWTAFQYTMAIGTGTSDWNTFVLGLLLHMRANITSNVDLPSELHFGSFGFVYRNNVSGTPVIALESKLDAEDLYIEAKVTSHLTMQNRTNDASGATNILSTSNNPVHGKHYLSKKKWLNGFDLSRTSLSTLGVGFEPLYTNQNTGIIAVSSTDVTGLLDYNTQILQKPPQGWVMGASHTKNIMVQPGAVRDSKLVWSAKMKWNTWIGKLGFYFCRVGSGAVNIVDGKVRRAEIGFCELFGYECMLNDRTETTQLQIGWELNQAYMCVASVKKSGTLPLTVVQ